MWAYFSTFSRVSELAAGALLAIGTARFNLIAAGLGPFLAWAGIAIIASSAALLNSNSAFPGPLAILPVVGTCLVIAAGCGGENAMWPFTNPVSAYIGNISYSLYLWHFPVIILPAALLPNSPRQAIAMSLLVTVAMSALSYHFIEQPIRDSRWLEARGVRDLPGRSSV